MQLFITSLNSGSNGNCYYIGNEQEAVLIDAGICCRQVEIRMKRLGLAMDKIKAIFVSHEHSDHIRGIEVLAKKYKLPVYLTPQTLRNSRLCLYKSQVVFFEAYQPVYIGNLSITAFPKLHDACDPHSFIVSQEDLSVGILTDIGRPCEHVMRHLSRCRAAFLEANYDEEMLENGRYPLYLKHRIRGGKGHLSNRQALQLFTSCNPSGMSHLLLSHLSHENNTPQLVKRLFEAHAGETEIVVASRFYETPVYTISHPKRNTEVAIRTSTVATQLQLPL
jgi:phosphoribosyl 1,2-cyclic phosphodiesterase